MRVRLFRLGESCAGDVIRIESFPVTLYEDHSGAIQAGWGHEGDYLCVLDEQHGNLVLVEHDEAEEARINDAPVESGGLNAGDIFSIGDRQFMVSYERTTSHPLPQPRYRIVSTVPS